MMVNMSDIEKDMRRLKRKCVMLCVCPLLVVKILIKNDVVSLILCCLKGFGIRLTDKQADGLW